MNYFFKTNSITFLILISALATSCVKQAENVDMPEYKPQLVLHSFISPSDTILYAQVSTTRNVFGPVPATPKNLPVKVSLIDGDKVIPFSSTDTSGVCSLQYQIFEGKTYGIIATCNGYPDVTGSCKIPNKGAINFQIDTITTNYIRDWGEEPVKEFKISYTDIPNQVNYYKVLAFYREYDGWGNTDVDNNFYCQPYNGDYNYNDCLLSDNLIDGQKINFIFWMQQYMFTYRIKNIKVDVLGTDKDYYLYHTSLKKYNDGENPFVEFSPVYSNLKGGFGIFCSYVKYEKVMSFPENERVWP